MPRQGSNPLVIEINRDITDRKQAELELVAARDRAEDANRMKSVFLANMSHEIRTPLTAILGFADVLVRQLTDTQKMFAERISQSSKRLSETLESVLTLARLEADRVELNPQVLDVVAEVKEVVAIYQAEARKNGLEMHLTLPPLGTETYALLDRGGLTSALQNLIGNAIKYTPAGHITVSLSVERPRSTRGAVELPEERLRIDVTDTGIGIAPEFIPHLFEPFSQESVGMARKYQGSGLGLSITRQLVEKMGGSISVKSEKGQGSRFSICFPLIYTPPVDSGESDNRRTEVSMDRRRLLVVEDDDGSRFLMKEVLQFEVGEVVTAATAKEALDVTRASVEDGSRPFDLVLLDINLGSGPDGQEVLRQIRAIPAYEHVPVVSITAYALPGDRDRFLSSGFNAYLRKPFSVEELTGLVTEYLGNRKER